MLTRQEMRRGEHGGEVISQRQAAMMLGVSVAHLNKVLRGKRVSARLTRAYWELVEGLREEREEREEGEEKIS